MYILDVLKSILFGIIEGITEWLPISSTGHMILFDEFMKMNVSEIFMETFLVVIQFGSILAVLFLYFDKLNPFAKKAERGKVDVIGNTIIKKQTVTLYMKVLVAVFPAAVI